MFAEDMHDSEAIKCLVEAVNPQLTDRARVVVQRNPSSLTRDALPVTVRSWLDEVAGVVQDREKIAEVVGVLVHQDADAADDDNADALRSALERQVAEHAHPVVPVQEMEAWWFLFPDSLRAVKREAWREVRMPTNVNVDKINSPKEDLIRRTRAASMKHGYAEADSLAVAQKMAAAIAAGTEPSNTSRSWKRFTALTKALYPLPQADQSGD